MTQALLYIAMEFPRVGRSKQKHHAYGKFQAGGGEYHAMKPAEMENHGDGRLN